MKRGLDQWHRFRDVIERREWMRFPSSDIEVWVPPGPMKAKVLDESFGGIGLLVRATAGLEVGSKITLIYNGCPMWAIVRYVADPSDEKRRIGFQWTGSPKAEKAVSDVESRARRTQEEEQALQDLIDPKSSEDTQWFVKEFPAGVRKMWDLYENARWDDLARTTSHLKQVASFLGFQQIAGDAEQLNDAVQQRAPKQETKKALEKLIETCTKVSLYEQARRLRSNDGN